MHPEEYSRLLALKTVKDRTSLSEMTIRRAIDRGEFPRPVRVTPNRIAWREPEVTAWINTRAQVAA